jgi:hypothetical protein
VFILKIIFKIQLQTVPTMRAAVQAAYTTGSAALFDDDHHQVGPSSFFFFVDIKGIFLINLRLKLNPF